VEISQTPSLSKASAQFIASRDASSKVPCAARRVWGIILTLRTLHSSTDLESTPSYAARGIISTSISTHDCQDRLLSALCACAVSHMVQSRPLVLRTLPRRAWGQDSP